MLKPTIDQTAVSALAAAALSEYVDGRESNDASSPQNPAGDAVNLEALCKQHPGRDGTVDGVVIAFDSAFQFALQLGARIGADPFHVPEVKDLVARFRFKKERAA